MDKPKKYKPSEKKHDLDNLWDWICSNIGFDERGREIQDAIKLFVKMKNSISDNRKSLGLYTIEDLEIDSEKMIHIMLNAMAKFHSEHYKQAILARTTPRMAGKSYQMASFLAKAIAKANIIKVKK